MTDSAAGTCSGCSAFLDVGSAFCASCGRPVMTKPASAPPLFGSSIVEADRRGRVRKASKWLVALSVIFAIYGTGYGLYARSQASDAKARLAELDDDQSFEVEGKSYTVGELEKQIDREVYLLFGLNYFLALVMFALYLWSRTSPFPAMVTGLCVYLAVIVLNAAFEPKTLAQGLILKFFFISAMLAGIKAALQERDSKT